MFADFTATSNVNDLHSVIQKKNIEAEAEPQFLIGAVVGRPILVESLIFADVLFVF